MRRRLWIAILAMPLSMGCAEHQHRTIVGPSPLALDDITGRSFNVLARNASESVILLGQMTFSEATDGAFTGTWSLRQWSGEDIPGLPASGSLTGFAVGTRAVIQVPLPGSTSSLGLIAEGISSGRIVGTVSLLPSQRFEGRFEAIEAAPGSP